MQTQLIKWMLGIAASIVTGLLVAACVSGMSSISEHGERLATLEANYSHLKAGQQQILEKLDELVECD